MVGMKKRKVYSDMQEHLLTQIRQKDLVSGQMIPDEFSLAASFKISRRSVRQGLQELVDKGMLVKQQGKGTFVSAPEHWQALQENEHRPLKLMLVYPGFFEKTFVDPFNQDLFKACMDTAHKYGHEIVAAAATTDTKVIVERYQRENCHGLLWVMAFEKYQPTIVELAKLQIPVVTINQELPGVSSVLIDSDLAMRTMIRFLYQFGHQRIGFINVDTPEGIYYARRDGYRHYMQEYGLPLDHYYEAGFDPLEGIPKIQLPWTRDNFPSALIVGGNKLLVPTLGILEKLGLKVGENVSLICIDDSLTAQINDPPISTYYEPRDELGREAISLLLNTLCSNRPSKIFIRGFLITRESCRMPPELQTKIFKEKKSVITPVPSPARGKRSKIGC